MHQELDSVLGNRRPTVDDLDQLPYTLQVIKEAMRLYPPAPFYIREAVASDNIAGHAIPAGSGVMMSPYYTHRHPQYWKNPSKFDPDRWTPEREAAQHPFAYHPFASGQRMCIGYSFSLLESHLLLALLACRFAPRVMPGYVPQWTMQSTLGTKNGFPMRIERRTQIKEL
jgi:cytochrome P450